MVMEDFCGTPFWNSSLTWATQEPDFTFCFEQTALIWAPCFFVWIFSILEYFYIINSRYKDIPWNVYNLSKSLLTFALICLSFVDLAMAIDLKESQGLYDVHIVTPVIKAVTFMLSGFLLYFQRRSGIHSSGLQFLFYLLLVVLGIAQLRTEINAAELREDPIDANGEIVWAEYQYISFVVYYTICCLLLLLNCFSDANPRHSDYPKTANPSPELSASFLRKLFYQWFDPVTYKGFRKPLDYTDLYDINPEDTSREILLPFDKYWNESIEKGKLQKQKPSKDGKVPNPKTTNGSTLPAMVKTFGGPFWFAGMLQIIILCLQFAQPMLLRQLITFVSISGPVWKGLLYAITLFIVFYLGAVTNAQYFERTFLVGFRIRTALVSLIYRKSLRVSSAGKKDTTVGEIVNLMAVDAQRFFELCSYLHILWSGPVTIAVCVWLLYDILGVAVFAGLGVIVIMIPFSGYIAARLKSLQVEQMNIKDERVKVMNEILGGIKVLKLYAWEPSFQNNVLKIRDKEVGVLKTTAYFGAGTYFVWTMAPFLVTLASFLTYVLIDEKNVLDPATAFVSLALFNILRLPLAMFPMMLTFATQAWVSVKRIDSFMNSEELDPDNVTHNKSEYGLQIKDGTFTWGDDNIILRNINMTVEKGKLSAVVGTVGTGKSSLISALLGEMGKKSGTINTDGTIAYIPQQAWIQNATLKDNVTFGLPFNQEKYDKIIEACALKPDIEMLPGGDSTEIGEKGINLSGGQKQRISLARAVYADSDIYLLDDPLSAVDAHVGKHIFEQVIGSTGVLAGKTRLLVTHAISYLPFVEEIFVIKEGEISECGSYTSLLDQKGAFADFLMQHIKDLSEEDEELVLLQETIKDETLLKRAMSIVSTNSGDSAEKRMSRSSGRKISKISEVNPIIPKEDKSKLIEKEEAATGSVGFGVYLRYLKNIGIWLSFWSIILNALNQGIAVYSSVWLSKWSESVQAMTDTSVRDMYLGVYGGLGFLQAFTLLIGSMTLALGCLKAASVLHNKLLDTSLRMPMSFFDTTPLGRIMNRFSKDMDIVDNILPMSVRAWILMFFNVIGIFIVISVSTPIFMVVIVPLGILYYLIQKFYVSTSRQLKRLESVTRSPIYSHFGETLTGASTIRAYGEQDRFILESEKRVDYNQMCAYPSIIANRWLGVRLELVGSLVVLFASLFAVLGRDTISPAVVGLSVSYALQISVTLNFLVRMTAEVETNIVAIERLEEYTELPQEAPWKLGEIEPEWPQEGKVEFKNYQSRYRDGLELVLKGISLSISGGEKIGIVGRTGAGKSSLTLGLFRIVEAAGGKIIIDEKDISTMGLHSLRSRLTIIPQDPVLFSGSLRMNIDPFSTYSDDDIWRVLEQSHLKSYVKGLATGLNHEVAEGGDNLSVGQRQLICLARALLRKTQVLVLDEATAAVDLETDDLIQKTIRTEFKECTILTIAHRLNTILDSDRVIVLDKGLIVENDKPQNLLQNKSTIFYSMAKNAGIVS